MIAELDTVVLTKDIPVAGLKKGDVGAVVHCHAGGTVFEVEFVAADGKPIALDLASGRNPTYARGRNPPRPGVGDNVAASCHFAF